jgi:hypothetical protein
MLIYGKSILNSQVTLIRIFGTLFSDSRSGKTSEKLVFLGYISTRVTQTGKNISLSQAECHCNIMKLNNLVE